MEKRTGLMLLALVHRGWESVLNPEMQVLGIKATGRGSRQMCQTDKYGFPRQYRGKEKRHWGYQTGDMVRAIVPSGKYAGTHVGRITIRRRPWFTLNKFGVHPKHLRLLQRADGYEYAIGTPDRSRFTRDKETVS